MQPVPETNAFALLTYRMVDQWVETALPGTTLEDPDNPMPLASTNEAFAYYLNKYGLPTDAHAARRMFEWAATLNTVWGCLCKMQAFPE